MDINDQIAKAIISIWPPIIKQQFLSHWVMFSAIFIVYIIVAIIEDKRRFIKTIVRGICFIIMLIIGYWLFRGAILDEVWLGLIAALSYLAAKYILILLD